MENSILKGLNVIYEPGQKADWTGRQSPSSLGHQYWHQAIELGDINASNKQEQTTIGIVGYSCDEGVRRNFGRVGAAKGPLMLKEKLAKLPLHLAAKKLVDFGLVKCVKEDMESCQLAFSKIIEQLITRNIFPIGIGGGHDIAYGHFMGVYEALINKPNHKIGIINFDAHFDLRPTVDATNSGTPFNQIIAAMKQKNEMVDYFVLGIQQQSNTKELFDIANKENVQYVTSFECEPTDAAFKHVQEKLAAFIQQNDYIYVSIDLDGFSSAYAPGVSAPSPLGFAPHFVYKILSFIFASKKVISCDLAELNPTLDQDNITANLAAKLVDHISSIA
ncbi:MAG: formimidoylglutamase [Bacteroidetes bacterium]|nr:formimidoylglutamase [Bacteroidota bacterium]